MSRLRFGAHMPTAGGLHNALTAGQAIGCDTVQIFTASPRQWSAKPLTDAAIADFKAAVRDTGITPVCAHDSYLINLATPEPDRLEQSRRAFLDEIERAEALGLDFVVTHMGAHTGSGIDAGIAQLAASLDWLHARTPGFRVRVALESTAGQGTYLGGHLEHFPQIFERVADADRLRACLDTCHLFVAGYDLRTPETVAQTLDRFGELVGFDRLCCIHANDAKAGLGSHLDRHEHIGEGAIGDEGFRAFLTDPRLPEGLPVIVETPEAETQHARNVARLRTLAGAA